MTAADMTAIITDLTNFTVAVTALLVAWRSHTTINSEIKPAQQATARAVVKVAEGAAGVSAADVKEIINGAAGD